MALKKKIMHNDEIDVSKLLKKWWSFKKKIIFGTILVSLLSTYILVLFNQTLPNQKIEFIRIILHGDLGKNNHRIIAALNSREHIQETLNGLDIKLDANDILNNLNVKKGANTLKETLQNRIISLGNKDINQLALSSEALSSIYNSLDDNSENIIEIEFYHLPLNLSVEQAKSFLKLIVKNANKKILFRTNRDELNLRYINIGNLDLYRGKNSDYEQLDRFSTMISSIHSNLSVLKSNYGNLLANSDIDSYISLANISQKLLYETSKVLGNTIAMDALDIEINNKNRDIEDLKTSFEILSSQQFPKIRSSDQENNTDDSSSTGTTQFDSAVFDKILSIGSLLELNDFRLETTSKIQDLQRERSNLIKQKDYLNLPLAIPIEDLNLTDIVQKIKSLSIFINESINDVRTFTEPKAAVEIINHPKLVVLTSNKDDLIQYVLILSLLGFSILSVISILRPSR